MNIVIQPSFAANTDWGALLGPADAKWGLVTDPLSASLVKERASFAFVEALQSFDEASLVRVLAPRIAVARLLPGPAPRLVAAQEEAYRITARLRERFGLHGAREDAVMPFLDKARTKERLAPADDLLPRWRRHCPPQDADVWARELVNDLGLPVFVKPIDALSPDPGQKIEDLPTLTEWGATHGEGWEIDEWLDGSVFHVDSLLRSGRILWTGACELLQSPATVVRHGTLGSWVLDAVPPGLEALNARVLALLRPPDGAVHLTAIRTRGGWRFLGVACRPAGWQIPEAYARACGVDLRVAHLRLVAGLDPELDPIEGPAAAWWVAVRSTPGRMVVRLRPRIGVAHIFEEHPESGELVASAVLWDQDARAVKRALLALDGFRPYRTAGPA